MFVGIIIDCLVWIDKILQKQKNGQSFLKFLCS